MDLYESKVSLVYTVSFRPTGLYSKTLSLKTNKQKLQKVQFVKVLEDGMKYGFSGIRIMGDDLSTQKTCAGHPSVVPPSGGRGRPEISKFEASLVYRVSSKTAKATER